MSNSKNSMKSMDQTKNNMKDKINLDYDWNSEYGDGDIPDVDKNSAKTKISNKKSY